ncbi:MAG: hypothetical protein R3B57_13855 [Phycisphaerales bacterium]
MPTRRRARTPLLASIILLAASSGALAQPASGRQPAPKQKAPKTVALSTSPVTIESLGLTLYLPDGAGAETVASGTDVAAVTTQIVFADASGVAAIHGKRTSDDDLDVKAVAKDLLDQMLASAGKVNAEGKLVPGSSQARVIESGDLTINAQDASRFYIQIPKPEGNPEVRGYTVFRPEPGRFVLFELFTTPEKFNAARVSYETMISSAHFASAGEVDLKRGVMVRAGAQALASLSAEDYRDVFTSFGQRWERLYSPSRSGDEADDQEFGYRRVRAWVGRRGELEPDKPEEKWSDAEREPGYLLRVDARLLENDMTVDSRGLYFLSIDREREAWSLRMAIRREGAKPSEWRETGARDGTSMAVRIEQDAAAPRVVRPLMHGEGYISMVETQVLPQLLIRAGVPADFAFYAYLSQAETIALRTDSVKMPEGKNGSVEIVTRPREDGPSQTATYASDGSLIHIDRPDGRIWEPTDHKRLLALWKSKGLPVN